MTLFVSCPSLQNSLSRIKVENAEASPVYVLPSSFVFGTTFGNSANASATVTSFFCVGIGSDSFKPFKRVARIKNRLRRCGTP